MEDTEIQKLLDRAQQLTRTVQVSEAGSEGNHIDRSPTLELPGWIRHVW